MDSPTSHNGSADGAQSERISASGPSLAGAIDTRAARAKRAWLAIGILVACIAVDQATKVIATRTLPFEPWSFLGDTFRLQLAYNTGAFLGMAGQLSANVRFWLLTVLNGGFLLVLASILIRHWRMGTGRFVACAAILAGGIGNLIDRATNNGQVTDFMNIGLGSLRSGIFNVADMAISGGALLLAWHWWREDPAGRSAERR